MFRDGQQNMGDFDFSLPDNFILNSSYITKHFISGPLRESNLFSLGKSRYRGKTVALVTSDRYNQSGR